MNKQLKKWRSITFLIFAVLTVFICQILFFLLGENYNESPAHFSAYPDSGYYEIDPETILDALDQGRTNVFIPYFGDWDRDEPYYDSIVWTQSNYLKIASALSLETWNEPLDLERWEVASMNLMRGCDDNLSGFHTFKIVYYKFLGIKNWEKQYTTRLIEILSWQGLVRWGGEAVFSAPVLLGWDGSDLSQFIFMADDALQIAEKNGGLAARQKVNNSCRITINLNQLPPLPQRENWLVNYERTDFSLHVDPYSGKYKILSQVK